MAHGLPTRWAPAHHREAGRRLAGDTTGSEDARHERAGRSAPGSGWSAGRFRVAALRDGPEVYLTYSEPGEGGSSLALARAHLAIGEGTASLEGLEVLWRQMPKGQGGQFGAQIAFSPDGQYLFLTVGDRQRMTPAQDPDQELGKVLRLTLDGKPAPEIHRRGKRVRRACR